MFGFGCKSKSASVPATPLVRETTASGPRFGIAEFFLSKSTVRLFWKTSNGNRIGTFDKLNDLVSASGDHLIFAANAGIFDSTFSPCGLHVENGQELVPSNLKTGTGNFYLKPSGIFLIDNRGPAIIESSQYLSLPAKPILATQSGPLFLVKGQINAQFAIDSDNRRIRSGIGVISSDRIVFVISRDPVTFYEFASFFQKTLHCPDALYLDGEVSKFYPDPVKPSDRSDNFAGIFAVAKRE
jgi:uncharacterized protein YigE (DUF2233 family)